MWNWIKKMWRWAFGPSIKSLTKNASALPEFKWSVSRPPAVAQFKEDLKIYLEDNPRPKDEQGPLVDLTQHLFDKGYFSSIGAMYKSLPLASLKPSEPMTVQKLAFLAWAGAMLPDVIDNEAHLVKVIRAWSAFDSELYRGFLTELYLGNTRGAVDVFNQAVEAKAFGGQFVSILNSMKKAVIEFLFPADNDDLTAARLKNLNESGGMSVYYQLLNTHTDGTQNRKTKTILQLETAKNIASSADGIDGAKKIISGLLKADILDNVNPIEEESVAVPVETGGVINMFVNWWNVKPAKAKDFDTVNEMDSSHRQPAKAKDFETVGVNTAGTPANLPYA